MKWKFIVLTLVISGNICIGQTFVSHKGILIYSNCKNGITLDKGFQLFQNTLDTILSIHTVFDSSIRVPDQNIGNNPIHIDKNFNNKTNLSRFPYYYSLMDHDVEDYDGGIEVLVVKFPSKEEANRNQKAVLKHFDKYGYDVFTGYISCIVIGNYLRLILISGEVPQFPKQLLSTFKVVHN
jgi:hypothetical protein